MTQVAESAVAADPGPEPIHELVAQVKTMGAFEAARLLEPHLDAAVVRVLQAVNPSTAQGILDELSVERRQHVIAAAPLAVGRQWLHNQSFADDSVGRLMDPAVAVFHRDLTVGECIEQLRPMVKTAFITYVWIVHEEGRLCGVVAMRELLFADKDATLDSVMVRDPFYLRPDMSLLEAMRLVLNRHYPEYPVCDAAGHLVGVVRGQVLFEAQAFELSAQAGSMVGVEREERLSTPWSRSLRFRHPWLQLNLLTAFLAGAVVSVFQGTIDEIVVLAVFLPILAGQSGNTGCQALAVTLRGMTLGDLRPGGERVLVAKEALLGLLNGALVGVSAAIGMYVLARAQGNPLALTLSFVVFLAMIGSCVVSGVSGALVPMTLKRLGADPATASSIFLTTSTDVASMGLLLGLATLLAR